jgi:quercetin dioxygenase-like cupin family protein
VERGEPAAHRSPFGDSLRWITGGEETKGAYSLHERIAPPGAASVPHIHRRVIEAFYILEGEFTFQLDERTLTAGPSTYVHVPAAVSHAWRVAGDATARALVLFAPSVPLAFFEEIDSLMRSAANGQPDPRQLIAINQKYSLD